MYRHLDVAMVRGAAFRLDDTVLPWPDVTEHADAPRTWRPWLHRMMRLPDFAAALEQASPSLTRRVQQIRDGRQPVPDPAVRSAVLSVMRYALRVSGRATPFGLFAGVAPAPVAATLDSVGAARIGERHSAVARLDSGWLEAVVERLEAERSLWPRLIVRANNLVFERDGRLVLEHRPQQGSQPGPVHVHMRATAPSRAAMALARGPIRLADLAGKLAARFPDAGAGAIDTLLSKLVAQGFVITNLRPSMTVGDPLRQLLEELRRIDAATVPEAALITRRLDAIADELHRHNTVPCPAGSEAARGQRARITKAMAALGRAPEPALALDLRLDWDVAVPECVAAEAATAAGALVRLAARADLHSGWAQWHGRFLERYGPRALVPVRDATDPDIGLGYPAGFLGAAPAPGRAVTSRDALLLAMAQKAALRRQHEIVLDETGLAELAEAREADQPAPFDSAGLGAQPTTELTVRVHASSEHALRQGDFTLAIVGASRAAGTTRGRFLSLLDDSQTGRERPWSTRLTESLAESAAARQGAVLVQVSAPPLHTGTQNVARAARALPHLLPVGEHHADGPNTIGLDDVAVAADAHRLYLVSLSRRRLLEPVMLNAVEPVRHTHPLARFLVEVPRALSSPCAVFDWGAATSLPFLPALRYGRSILSPARWLLTSADLPASTASPQEWEEKLEDWRHQVGLPQRCFLGDGDQRIGVDLAEPAHRELLRAQLRRTGTTSLRAIPESAYHPGSGGEPETAEWWGAAVHEIVVPLVANARPSPPPAWLTAPQRVAVRSHGHLPGTDGRFYLKLYCHHERQTAILTRHLPRLLDDLDAEGGQCWFLRYRDPHPHLRLRTWKGGSKEKGAAPTTAALAAWTEGLRREGLVAHVQWDTDFPETARFGGAAATEAAESYFAADSSAAVAELTAGGLQGGADIRALTAASLLDIAVAFLPETSEALRWLIHNTRPTAPAPPRWLYDQALALANPHEMNDLVAHPGGWGIANAWGRRRNALSDYRTVLHATGMSDVSMLLPELLHLHHVRNAGVDLEDERACLHLARAAALSWSTRPCSTRPPTTGDTLPSAPSRQWPTP